MSDMMFRADVQTCEHTALTSQAVSQQQSWRSSKFGLGSLLLTAVTVALSVKSEAAVYISAGQESVHVVMHVCCMGPAGQ